MRRSFFVLIALSIALRAADPFPPVYFNHVTIFLDEATLEGLVSSSFLKNEFARFDQITTQRDGGNWSSSGVYVFGERTFLEFIPATADATTAAPTSPATAPSGSIFFNLWIDDRLELPLVRNSLATHTQTDPQIRPLKFFVNGRDLNGFDSVRAAFPTDKDVRTGTGVMAAYSDYLKQRYPELKPNEDGTTRQKVYGRRYLSDRLLHDITRFTLTVNEGEEARLMKEFAAYGYSLRRDGDKQIAVGPEIEFVLLPSAENVPRRFAIEVKLNRSTSGNQRYRLGDGSELELHETTASWYFPAGWRP